MKTLCACVVIAIGCCWLMPNHGQADGKKVIERSCRLADAYPIAAKDVTPTVPAPSVEPSQATAKFVTTTPAPTPLPGTVRTFVLPGNFHFTISPEVSHLLVLYEFHGKLKQFESHCRAAEKTMTKAGANIKRGYRASKSSEGCSFEYELDANTCGLFMISQAPENTRLSVNVSFWRPAKPGQSCRLHGGM